jgi:hypothetical protein
MLRIAAPIPSAPLATELKFESAALRFFAVSTACVAAPNTAAPAATFDVKLLPDVNAILFSLFGKVFI